MLEYAMLDKLVLEVYSRLCMMDEQFEYEIPVPGREALLGIVGGGKQREFRLIPIRLGKDGSREELPAKSFTHRIEGTIEIAGHKQPNIRVLSVDKPAVELWHWLRSDPWSTHS